VLTPLLLRYLPTNEYWVTKNAASNPEKSARPKARKPFPACATSITPTVATSTLIASLEVVRSFITSGERTASITGLVFTKNVAFAIVVSLTAKMKVAKCRLRNTPETATRVKSRLPRNRKLRLAHANRIIAKAAMKRRKNASDIAEASVANLMKIALVAKKKEATKRAAIPLDANKKEPLADFGSSAYDRLHRALSFNYVSDI